MVLPLYGPATKVQTINVNLPGSYRKYQRGYRQKRPYNLPSAYISEVQGMLEASYESREIWLPVGSMDTWCNVNNGRSPYQYTAYLYSDVDVTAQALINACRAKFTSKIGDSAQLLAALGESKKTMSLLTQRVTQMAYFFRSIKRRDFLGAADHLGLTEAHRRRVKGKSAAYIRRWKAKTFADRSLEFAFGWAPTMNDISTSMDILSRPLPYNLVKARKNFSYEWVHGPFYADGQNGNRGYTKKQAVHSVKMRVEIGAGVRVSNPNLYLAAQLGLTNLAGTAWELAPWSFIVDYWFNVSQFLGQWTEYGGLSFDDPYHTLIVQDNVFHTDEYFRYGHIPETDKTPYYGKKQYKEYARRIERKLGIPSVTLTKKLPWRLSAFRAWTSVSLLLQQGFKSYR